MQNVTHFTPVNIHVNIIILGASNPLLLASVPSPAGYSCPKAPPTTAPELCNCSQAWRTLGAIAVLGTAGCCALTTHGHSWTAPSREGDLSCLTESRLKFLVGRGCFCQSPDIKGVPYHHPASFLHFLLLLLLHFIFTCSGVLLACMSVHHMCAWR